MRKATATATAVCGSVLGWFAVATSLASDRAASIDFASQLPERWSPDQHLWVKGDVGVGAEQLDRLERWLDNEAPNWTVVIAANASGETYQAADGRNHSGMDAVEYALGQGLANKTPFGELRDSRTGEKNGASFVIFLRERKFSYAGAGAYDRRGLGEAHWVGHLDRPAFRAMSNGGRVVDAVTATVSEIDGRLTRSLAQEQRRREEDALRAQRLRAEARAAVDQAAVDLTEIETQAEEFRAENEAAVGDLANPRLLHWNAQLESARALLEAGRDAEAAAAAAAISDFARAFVAALARHPAAPPRFEDLNRAIAELNPERGGWGAAQLEEARRALGNAQAAHARGESDYEEHFRAAEAAFYSANEEIARSRVELQRRLKVESELQEAAGRRERLARRGAAAGGIAVGCGGLGLGLLLNRRRRPFMVEAKECLERWETRFRESRERMFALLDRAQVVVGTETELDKRGYSGETEELSRAVIRDVDRLFVMSASVDRVLDGAQLEIQPRYGFQRIHNLFGTSRYRRAVAILKDLPIQFRPEDGVAPIARPDEGEDGRPLGRVETQEAFALTFEELMAQFTGLAESARTKLDTIENAWAEIDAALSGAQVAIDRAAHLAAELRERSAEDGLFAIAGAGETLLPSAQADLDRATAQASSDPVGALRLPLPMARRKAGDVQQLCEVLQATRDQRMPEMAEHAEALIEAGRSDQWIGRSLGELSVRADQLIDFAFESEAGTAVAELDSELDGLRDDVRTAVELVDRAAQRTRAAVEAATAAARGARQELGEVLDLPASELLREAGLDPDVILARARDQHGAALLAIDRGGVAAAAAALGEAEALCEEATAIVEISRRSAEEHQGNRGRRADEEQALRAELPEHQQLVDAMRDRYAADALHEKAGGDDAEDVGDWLRAAQELVHAASAAAGEADACRGRGALIEAASRLTDSADGFAAARASLAAIREHQARLEQTEAENRSRLNQLADEQKSLQGDCDERRTRRATISYFDASVRRFEGERRDAKSGKPDPFALALALSEIDAAFSKVGAMVASDRDLFEEARRSLSEAGSHIAVAKRLSHQASHDQIPDSRRTLELQEEIEKLGLAELAAERRLRVAHEDWAEIDAEADRISLVAGRMAAELRGELERAQAAVASLASASEAVREATGWSGSFGVRIEGSPGGSELHRARDFLLSGRYLETRRLADDARRRARHALSAARNAEARARRRARQREEEERRRRAARRRRSSFGSGGSSFRSSSGSSSSMSRSSFRSSSGMSRSGW